jgi:hypothetical protein
MRERLDDVTRMLCEALTMIENPKRKRKGVFFVEIDDLEPATRKWWLRHKRIDRERIAAQQAEQERQSLRKSALAKLTRKERRALQLDKDYD